MDEEEHVPRVSVRPLSDDNVPRVSVKPATDERSETSKSSSRLSAHLTNAPNRRAPSAPIAVRSPRQRRICSRAMLDRLVSELPSSVWFQSPWGSVFAGISGCHGNYRQRTHIGRNPAHMNSGAQHLQQQGAITATPTNRCSSHPVVTS